MTRPASSQRLTAAFFNKLGAWITRVPRQRLHLRVRQWVKDGVREVPFPKTLPVMALPHFA
jgi:hypothetical protein